MITLHKAERRELLLRQRTATEPPVWWSGDAPGCRYAAAACPEQRTTPTVCCGFGRSVLRFHGVILTPCSALITAPGTHAAAPRHRWPWSRSVWSKASGSHRRSVLLRCACCMRDLRASGACKPGRGSGSDQVASRTRTSWSPQCYVDGYNPFAGTRRCTLAQHGACSQASAKSDTYEA